MKHFDDETLDRYLNGELAPDEAAEVCAFVEGESFPDDPSDGRVGDALRSLDRSGEFFAGVDLTARVRTSIERSPFLERRTVWVHSAVAVAAALVLAFLAVLFLPGDTSGPGHCGTPVFTAVLNSAEFLAPGSEKWSPVPDEDPSLAPGTLVRAVNNALLAMADGSSISLSPQSVIRIGGSADHPFSIELVRGEMTADLRSGVHSFATAPTTIHCRSGIFTLTQQDPLTSSTQPHAQFTATRSWQWVATLAVHSGVIQAGAENYTEGSYRVWPYENTQGPASACNELR